MLRNYESYADVPEALREHYIQVDNKFIPQLDDAHPVLKRNGELLRELAAQKAQVTRLTNEKGTLEASTLADGQVAISADDAKFLEKFKNLSVSPAEAKLKLEGYDALKSKDDMRAKQDGLRRASHISDYDGEKIVALEDRFPSTPYVREVDEGGQKIERSFIKVKEGDKEVEKTFDDFIRQDPKLAPLASLLKAPSPQRSSPVNEDGPRWPQQPAGGRAAGTKTLEEVVAQQRDQLISSGQYTSM